MSARSKKAAEMRTKFSHSDLKSQLRRFALSSIGYLLGPTSELETMPYNSEDDNSFTFLFADSLNIQKTCRDSGAELSQRFSMTAPPAWSPNQLIHIESALEIDMKPKSFFANFMSESAEHIIPFEIAEIRNAVARSVLHSATFQSQVSKAFYLYLRTRVVMYPDGGETPKLSIATYWLLIYTFVDKIFNGMNELDMQVVKAGLAQVIQHYSQNINGWASFWDLYVFHLISSDGYWLPRALEKSKNLLNSLQDDTKSHSTMGPTMQNWQYHAPDYAKFLLNPNNSI